MDDDTIIRPDIEEWEIAAVNNANREHHRAYYRECRMANLYSARMFLNGAIKQTERLQEDAHILALARKKILLFCRLRAVDRYLYDRRYDLTPEEKDNLESTQLELFR